MATLQEVLAIDHSLSASPPGTASAAPAPAATGSDSAFGYTWSDPALAAKMQAAQAAIGNPNFGKPQAPAGKLTGWAANVGAGTSEGVAETLGFLPDVATAAINLPIEGVNAAAGTHIPTIQHPVGGTQWWEQAEGLVGANPQDVVPGSRGQQLARAAASGATGMLLPGGVARELPAAGRPVLEAVREGLAGGATVGGAAAGAAGGVGGQLAQDEVPDRFKPLANFLGQLTGGGIVAGGEAALRAAPRAAADVVHAVAGPTGIGQKAAPVLDPETGRPFTQGAPGEERPVVATPWQRQAAGHAIARAAGQEPGELAASVPPQPELVPGVQHTMGTVTGDLGLLGEERRLRNTPAGRAAFTDQEAQNNIARVASLDRASPTEAREAARNWMQSKLQAMQAEEESNAATGRAAGEQALEAAGAGANLAGVQQIGQGQQAALETMRAPAKAAASRALDAIDKEGTLAVNASSLGDKAREILKGVGEGDTLEGVEAGPLNAAAAYRGVEPFSKLRSLLGTTAAAMRRIARNPELGRESLPYRRMTQLMDGIHGALSDAAGRAAGDEVAGGAAPGERIIDTLHGVDRSATGTAPEGHVTAGGGPALAEQPGGGPSAANGALGAGGETPAGAQRSSGGGNTGGNPGVAAPPATPRALLRKPQNLLEFLTERGGIKPDADLRAMGADAYHHRAGGRLLSPKGQPADYAREAAVQEGFLGPNADINALKDKIAEGLAGRHTYRQSEAFEGHQYEQAAREQAAYDAARGQARDEVLAAEDGLGMHLSRSEIEHAIDMRMQSPDLHPEEALRMAAAASEQEMFQRNAQRDAFGFPGLPAGAVQTEATIVPRLAENFSPEDRAAVRAANRQYAEYKDTFRKGVVGDVLRPGVRPGEFATGAAMVPGKLWVAGPKGADVASELIGKFGQDKAREILGDYPALTLRNDALKSGEWDDAGYQRWRNRFAPVLAKFPELAKQFQTAAEAQRSIADAAAAGQQRIRDFENSAARFYLGKSADGADLHTAIQRLMSSENPGAAARDLMKQVSGNDAATEGVRRNTLEWLMNRTRATAEAGTTGESEIAGATLQRLVGDPKVSAALRSILKPEQMRTVLATARDLRLAARAWNAVKVPGSPTTAADLMAHLRAAGGHPISQLVQLVLAERAGEALGNVAGAGGHGLVGGALGVAGAVGARYYQAMRAAGLANVEQLQIAGMLNPALGRVLLQDAVANPRAPILRDTARRILALATGATLTSHSQGKH